MGRTLVAGSTSPGGRSAITFWFAEMAAAMVSAERHGAVARSTGLLMVTPHGTTSLPLPARVVSSLRVMTAFRLVSPVTTASGKLGRALAVGLGVGTCVGVGGGVADGDGVGEGLELTQPARSASAIRAEPRLRDERRDIARNPSHWRGAGGHRPAAGSAQACSER